MGATTFATCRIHNIDTKQILNYLSERFDNLVQQEPCKCKGNPQQSFVSVFPMTQLGYMEQDGNDVVFYDFVKWMSFEDAAERYLSFQVIRDLGPEFGDAELKVTPYQDDLRESKQPDNSLYRGESFPPKQRKTYGQYVPLEGHASTRMRRFLVQYLRQESSLPTKLFKEFQPLLLTGEQTDLWAFYNAVTLSMWLYTRTSEKDYDISRLTEDNLAKWLSSQETWNTRVTTRDVNSLVRLFQFTGNDKAANYCQTILPSIGRVEQIFDGNKGVCEISTLERRFTASAEACFDLRLHKTFGWGFRNFDSFDLDIRVDNTGVHTDIQKYKAQLVQLSYPVVSRCAGYYISDENIEEALNRTDREEAVHYLLGCTYQSKKASLQSLLPELNLCRLYLANQRKFAEVFYDAHHYVILSVPFAEKDEAREAGAVWDADKKVWKIIGNSPNIDSLKPEWLPKK